jgi:quinol monooxygenase YgiN
MHVAIRRYQTDPASVDAVMQQVNEGFIPIIKDADGFLAYYALKASESEIATVSVFEDQAGAEESIRMAAEWVRDNLAALLPNPPEITAGEVGAHELNLTKLGVSKVRGSK